MSVTVVVSDEPNKSFFLKVDISNILIQKDTYDEVMWSTILEFALRADE